MNVFVDSETWSKVDVKGDIPIPCSASALTAVGDKLYLFGGLSHEIGWLDSLYVFNTGKVCSHQSGYYRASRVERLEKFYYGPGSTFEEC